MMKYAVVTGSTKGIGKQIGIDLLERGYFVFFNYGHDDSAVPLLKKDLDQISKNYLIIKNNFSSIDDIQHFVKSVRKTANLLDVLVLNAGTTDRTSFDEMTIESFNRVVMTNLTAPCFLVQQFKPFMQHGSSIIFIGSLLGNVPHSVSIPYSVTKSAVHMLAKSLVKEFCECGVRVNAVAPGFTETPWQSNKPDEIRKNIENKVSLHRFAKPKDISDAVLFLIDNSFMNGAVVSVDGGYCYR